MLKIGITGGIGSGKSTAARFFEALGIPLYDADQRAKWLMQNDQKLQQDLIAAFGADTYDPAGGLNRPYLAEKVFKDKAALAQLNALVHPVVKRDTQAWQAQMQQAGHPYCLKEAALIFEANLADQFDKIIVVTAPLELRISRVMARDQLTESAVLARINNQWPEEEKIKRADYILENTSLEALQLQVQKLDQEISKLARNQAE